MIIYATIVPKGIMIIAFPILPLFVVLLNKHTILRYTRESCDLLTMRKNILEKFRSSYITLYFGCACE